MIAGRSLSPSGPVVPWSRAGGVVRERYLLVLLPSVAFLAALFVFPIGTLLWRSVSGGSGELSLSAYERLVSESVYVQVFIITFRIALEATVITLVLGYPLAYFFAGRSAAVASALMVVVMLPFFTSALVRTYAWIVLLGNAGMVNQALSAIGVPGAPIQLLYNEIGVMIGMSYVLLPYMVLAIYSVMRGIDRTLLQAAASVGATPARAFWRIFLPLSLPGVVAGCLLTFILGVGFYITPALMGGPRETMAAMLIAQSLELSLDWGFAAALAAVLLGLTVLGFFAYDRLVGMERLFEAKI